MKYEILSQQRKLKLSGSNNIDKALEIRVGASRQTVGRPLAGTCVPLCVPLLVMARLNTLKW